MFFSLVLLCWEPKGGLGFQLQIVCALGLVALRPVFTQLACKSCLFGDTLVVAETVTEVLLDLNYYKLSNLNS